MAQKKNVKPVPDGYPALTPYLTVKGASRAMDFYARVFGAQERYHLPGPDGRIAHAEMQIGSSVLMLADECPERGAHAPSAGAKSSASVFAYVDDVDAVFAKATAAGAKTLAAPADMFWGDRYGKLVDPFGHEWALATHVEDVAPEEMQRRMSALAPAQA
jgi:PhnB protein